MLYRTASLSVLLLVLLSTLPTLGRSSLFGHGRGRSRGRGRNGSRGQRFITRNPGFISDRIPLDELFAREGNMKHKNFLRGELEPSRQMLSNGKEILIEYDILLPSLVKDEFLEETIGDTGRAIKNRIDDILSSIRSERSRVRGGWRRRAKRSAVTSRRWPNNRVPYKINRSQFSSLQLQNIEKAIQRFNSFNCLQWVEDSQAKPVVSIEANRAGCFASLGYFRTFTNRINLGGRCSNSMKTIWHEMLHVAGVYHQHTRPDRDSFVTINTRNIRPNYQDNFDIAANSLTLGTAYDYRSIMHYSQYAFTSGSGKPTIIAKDSSMQDVMGRATEFSDADIQLLKRMYSCQECSALNQNCACQNTRNACSVFSRSRCNRNTGACECNTGLTAVNGKCTDSQSVRCDKIGVDCQCSRNPSSLCDQLDNTVCESNKCVCAQGFEPAADGTCVEISCRVAEKKCFCSTKGGDSACGPNASCIGDFCKCKINFFSMKGACTRAPSCNELGKPCFCDVQSANPCSRFKNSQCRGGSCECVGLYTNVGGKCVASRINDGSSIKPLFSNKGDNSVNWVVRRGPDHSQSGIESNSLFLFVQGNGAKSGTLETSGFESNSERWIIEFSVALDNSQLTFGYTTSARRGRGRISPRSLRSSSAFNRFRIRTGQISGPVKFFFTAGPDDSSSSWSVKLDTIRVFKE